MYDSHCYVNILVIQGILVLVMPGCTYVNMYNHSYMYIVNNIVIDVHGCVHVHVSLSLFTFLPKCVSVHVFVHIVYVGAFV